ncbi:MAG: WG repeat-containing protein [Bacteroidia bacterium]|nr:WG repeat-containing protein [Bacteroidia bacterium]
MKLLYCFLVSYLLSAPGYAQNKLFEVASNDTVTDGLPYYLIQKKDKKPIDDKRYHSIEEMENGWFKTEAYGSRFGLISNSGVTVFASIYQNIEQISSENKNEKWVYILLYDTLNKVTLYNPKTGKKINTTFDNSETFCGGSKLISVEKDNKYGFINASTDSLLFPCMFSSWQSLGNDWILVGLGRNENRKRGVINENGWMIPPAFTDVFRVSENVLSAAINENASMVYLIKEKRFLSDTSYNFIIANDNDPIIAIGRAGKYKYVLHNYQTGTWLKDSFDEVNTRDFQLTTAVRNEQWFILDKEGRIVGNAGKWKSCRFLNDELMLVTDSSDMSGLLNKTGRLIVPVAYQSLYTTSVGEGKNMQVVVCKTQNKTGLMSINGETLIAPGYSSITLLSATQKWMLLENDSKYGVSDINGKIIVPCIYEKVSVSYTSGDISVQQNGKFGLLNNKGEVIIPAEYDGEIYFDKKGKATVSKNGISLTINRKNMPCN